MQWRNAWPAVVVAVAGSVVAAVMAIAGINSELIIEIATIMVVPVIAALVAGQQAQTGATVEHIRTQTNGNISQMLTMLQQQTRMLAESTPPPGGYHTDPPAPAPAPAPAPGASP